MTTENTNKKSLNHKDFEKGFSIVEMLVSMVIFLIVVGSIYGLLTVGRVARNRSSQKTDVLKNARAAIHLIGRDALNAGLGYHQSGALVPDNFISDRLGIPEDTDTTRDILTSIIPGNNIFSNNLQEGKTDIVAFAYRDLDFNDGNAITLANAIAGSDSSVVRLELGTNATTRDLTKHDLVLVEADTTQVAIMVTEVIDNKNIDFAPTDPLGINQALDAQDTNRSLLKKCSDSVPDNCTTVVSSLKRFFWVSYKIKDDGTLVRISYANNTGQPGDEQIQERPLAYNVKDLQLTYVLENGTVTDNPVAGPDGVAGTADDTPNYSNLIRQITISLEVQSTERDEQTGKPVSIKLSGTFSTRNLEYDVG